MRTASDVLKDHVFSILDDVLVLLSGQGFPTPEKTYKLDGGWGLALSDLRRCFNEHRARIGDLEAERDAARAGEARAVEALKGVAEAGWLPDMEEVIHSVDCTCDFCDQNRLLETIEQILSDDAQPALDWLARREREAAVRELKQLMESEWKWEEFELKASIHARIAALTNQQPTACFRSEVRGNGQK
jgi:hypothetical protein